jgi:Zn-dependent M28 family amino/carboxypeptidase
MNFTELVQTMRRLAFLAFLVAGCVGASGVATVAPPAEFSGELALGWAAWQMGLGPRIPGLPAHEQATAGIAAQLTEVGWQVYRQEFPYQGTALTNIVASHGEGPEGAVILGAHYDTRPRADLDPEDTTVPVPGANDGASGVAVLLEIGRVLSLQETLPPVWLVFFDGEDAGSLAGWEWIVGSTYFVASLDSAPASAVIVDMVGDADLQLFWERGSDPTLRQQIWDVASSLGYTAFVPEERHALLDDHTPFLQAGIPAIDIIDFDYPYWHTAADTLDKISADSLEQVGRTVLAWLLEGG